jgi:arsenate reductase
MQGEQQAGHSEQRVTKRVLFICTGNSARSQMAEAFVRHYAAEQFEAYSAGLEPKGMNPLTVQVMQEIGLDLSGQHSKGVGEYLGKVHFAYVVTVCSDAEERCPSVFLGMGRRLHWGFEDPAALEGTDEARLAKFRQIRDEIERRVCAWLEELGLPTQCQQRAEGA